MGVGLALKLTVARTRGAVIPHAKRRGGRRRAASISVRLCVGRALALPAFDAVGTLARELRHGIEAGAGSVDAERDPDAYADAGGDSFRECSLDVASDCAAHDESCEHRDKQ